MMRLAALWLALSGLILGCSSQEVIGLEKEERFVLNLGAFEDELDLFLRNGQAPSPETYLALQDGMFYILNGPRAKVLEFTSFGDLLSMIYNPDLNPPPLTLKVLQSDEVVSNKVAHPFPFHFTGKFVVTPTRDLYIQDRQPTLIARPGEDQLPGSVILRFDRKGQYQDYIGQEGVAGTPFPGYVHGVYTDASSGLYVATRDAEALTVFGYSRAGDLRFRKVLRFADLPVPQEYRAAAAQTVFETLAVDWTDDALYVHVTYLAPILDTDSRAQVGVQALGSWVHTFDLKSDAWAEGFSVPKVTHQEREGELTRVYDRPLEFLGVTQGRDFCFLGLDRPGVFRVLFTDTKGDILEQRGLEVDLREMYFYRFTLASNGTLAALLSDGRRVRAVWWRTDRLLGLFNATPGF